MTVGTILALVLTIPLILIPVALVWYINIGGIYAAIKEAQARKTVPEKEAKAVEAR